MRKAEDLIAIAEKYVGYHEKATNADLEDFTANSGNKNFNLFSKVLHDYGYFGGSNKNGLPWCDCFVDYCFLELCEFNRSEAEDIECQTGNLGACCTYSANYYKKQGRFDKDPKIGDQIFFQNGSSGSSHTGIVWKVTDSYVYTIEGNSGDQVKKHQYQKSNSKIYGYGHPKYNEEFDSTIRKGSSGESVKEIQSKLISEGYSCGSSGVDGVFGAATYEALISFQKDNGLPETGVVDEATEHLLSKISVHIHGILRRGSTGSEVVELQEKLISIGISCGNSGADGFFGRNTSSAVRTFQMRTGLVPDGIVGTKTWNKLDSMT